MCIVLILKHNANLKYYHPFKLQSKTLVTSIQSKNKRFVDNYVDGIIPIVKTWSWSSKLRRSDCSD